MEASLFGLDFLCIPPAPAAAARDEDASKAAQPSRFIHGTLGHQSIKHGSRETSWPSAASSRNTGMWAPIDPATDRVGHLDGVSLPGGCREVPLAVRPRGSFRDAMSPAAPPPSTVTSAKRKRKRTDDGAEASGVECGDRLAPQLKGPAPSCDEAHDIILRMSGAPQDMYTICIGPMAETLDSVPVEEHHEHLEDVLGITAVPLRAALSVPRPHERVFDTRNDAGAAEPDDESLSPPIDVERNESSMAEHISRLVRVHLAGLYRREIEYPVPAIALADNELNIFKQASLTRADRWACVDAMRKLVNAIKDHRRVFHLAVAIYDLFVASTVDLTAKVTSLLAPACVWLSSKLESVVYPGGVEFARLFKAHKAGAFPGPGDKRLFKTLEGRILKAIKYRVNMDTSYDFLHYMLLQASLKRPALRVLDIEAKMSDMAALHIPDDYRDYLLNLDASQCLVERAMRLIRRDLVKVAMFYLDMIVHETHDLNLGPSCIAAGVFKHALAQFSGDSEDAALLFEITGYTAEDEKVREVALWIKNNAGLLFGEPEAERYPHEYVNLKLQSYQPTELSEEISDNDDLDDPVADTEQRERGAKDVGALACGTSSRDTQRERLFGEVECSGAASAGLCVGILDGEKGKLRCEREEELRRESEEELQRGREVFVSDYEDGGDGGSASSSEHTSPRSRASECSGGALFSTRDLRRASLTMTQERLPPGSSMNSRGDEYDADNDDDEESTTSSDMYRAGGYASRISSPRTELAFHRLVSPCKRPQVERMNRTELITPRAT